MYDEHANAIRTLMRRGYLTGLDDSGQQQLVNLARFVGDTPQKVVRLQHAGLTSTPTYGEGLVLGMGGRADNIWALGLENPGKRITGLPDGATALYDESGNVIKLIGKTATFAFTNAGWEVTSKGATISSNGAHIVVDPGDHLIHLGGPSNSNFVAVMTVNGPSTKVFAKV